MMDGNYLAIETSTPRGSLALVTIEGEILFERTFESARSHNSLLFAPLQEALEIGYLFSGIIVGTGPGSYTGVRIGISAALGISLAKDVPVAGVPSLTALQDVPESGNYHVIGDARRGSYFHAEVRDWNLAVDPALFTVEELTAHLEKSDLPVFTCDSAPLLVPAQLTSPAATELANTARHHEPDFSSPVVPIYLRAPYTTTPKPKSRPATGV
ncbi:MAG: tRNA threonylcarbamoyladenosine biosynthesis protein TsaB [Verrucomicrobiales bacterium]|jgi:tRNA threonylcarbamoyladenosine biosynthesis protein TsaB